LTAVDTPRGRAGFRQRPAPTLPNHARSVTPPVMPEPATAGSGERTSPEFAGCHPRR